MANLNWTVEKLELLKKDIQAADKESMDVFTFTDPDTELPHDFVVSYAKYLVQHLEAQFHE